MGEIEKKYKATRAKLLSGQAIARAMSESKFRRLNSEELLERIIHHFGGTDKFAFELVSFYNECGSVMAKQRIIDMVTRLFVSHTQLSKEAAPLENLETEDLEALLLDAVRRIQESVGHDSRVHDPNTLPSDKEFDNQAGTEEGGGAVDPAV